jgi:hypothetical protein
VFWGCLFSHQRSFILIPLHVGLLLFSSEVFCFEPLAVWGCLFFYRTPFVFSPLRFGGYLFFFRGLLFWAPCILGFPLFLSEVFSFEPLAFCGCLFFHQRSFVLSQRMKVAILHLRSRLWITWHNSLFVEYGASVASDFDDGDQYFRETKIILLLWGYMCSASLITSRPRRLPL